MWLFLASLAMLFIASLIGYVFIRHLNRARYNVTLHFPALLWVSTGLVMAVSLTLGLALYSVRRERQGPFRRWIKLALAGAIAFIAVQTPAMASLFTQHRQARAMYATSDGTGPGMGLYGLVFFMILLHALHVIGGLVAMSIVTAKGMRGAYDHEHYAPVRYAAMYWHFLDVVWLAMFATLLIAA